MESVASRWSLMPKVMLKHRCRCASKVRISSYYSPSPRPVAVESCLVVPPPSGTKPRGIVELLGGAFIGAVPEVSYGYVMELLAKEGFVVICVPYEVTFDHHRAAQQVYGSFNLCLDSLFHSGIPFSSTLSPRCLSDLPLFSLGHSNGALLQVLTASYFSERIPKANAIVAFNNRPASEAVPYFDQLGPLLRQLMPILEASPLPLYSLGDCNYKSLVNLVDPDTLISLSKFAHQLPSVFGEVSQGISEFKPTPLQNRESCRTSYNVKHTLLVKFDADSIDETDVIEEALRPRVESIGGTLEKVQLSGNHITPCIQEPTWEVGKVYTAADAVAQGLKTLSLKDVRGLVTTITDWFAKVS